MANATGCPLALIEILLFIANGFGERFISPEMERTAVGQGSSV
jgi:hypothetical protein